MELSGTYSSHGVAGPIVGRFAPSPSGRMHLGNVFSSLVAWLSARSQDGRIVLRIEDLDPRTQSGPWADLLIEDLKWLGLEWDEGPYYQRDRVELYQGAYQKLVDAGLTYPCFCTRAELHAASAPHASDGTPIYAGTCRRLSAEETALRSLSRPPATRLRVPTPNGEPFLKEISSRAINERPNGFDTPANTSIENTGEDTAGTVAFTDRTYGPQSEDLARECGDFLIRRSDGVFAYQLAVVVDDADMGITEVVRGCDLLGSTARQIYLQNLLGLPHPEYAHVPLLMAPDGRRLSKRDHDLAMDDLKERFGTPEALLGWLAGKTGIAPSTEPQSAAQLAESFSWESVRTHRENLRIEP